MITAKHINEHGKVALWEATDDGHIQVMLPAVDAAHALQADPERWSLDKPETGERSASEYGGGNPVDPDLPPQPVPADPYPTKTTAERDDSEKGSG